MSAQCMFFVYVPSALIGGAAKVHDVSFAMVCMVILATLVIVGVTAILVLAMLLQSFGHAPVGSKFEGYKDGSNPFVD